MPLPQVPTDTTLPLIHLDQEEGQVDREGGTGKDDQVHREDPEEMVELDDLASHLLPQILHAHQRLGHTPVHDATQHMYDSAFMASLMRNVMPTRESAARRIGKHFRRYRPSSMRRADEEHGVSIALSGIASGVNGPSRHLLPKWTRLPLIPRFSRTTSCKPMDPEEEGKEEEVMVRGERREKGGGKQYVGKAGEGPEEDLELGQGSLLPPSPIVPPPPSTGSPSTHTNYPSVHYQHRSGRYSRRSNLASSHHPMVTRPRHRRRSLFSMLKSPRQN